jgi:hypothetical protein
MRGRCVISLLNMALVAIDFGARAQGYVEHREALWCRTCIADEVAVQHIYGGSFRFGLSRVAFHHAPRAGGVAT